VEITVKKNRLYFRDNGKGISPEILPRIFDKFFTSSKAGTGVGLAFCKLVMEGMNGTIECESNPEEYTLFKLSFPKIN
jgi:signal transduction histidine kinase